MFGSKLKKISTFSEKGVPQLSVFNLQQLKQRAMKGTKQITVKNTLLQEQTTKKDYEKRYILRRDSKTNEDNTEIQDGDETISFPAK